MASGRSLMVAVMQYGGRYNIGGSVPANAALHRLELPRRLVPQTTGPSPRCLSRKFVITNIGHAISWRIHLAFTARRRYIAAGSPSSSRCATTN